MGGSMKNRIMIKPSSLKEANEFITVYHRHHKAVRGCKFCIKAVKDGEVVGVAICGRPVSRYLDNGETVEITRLCTNDRQRNVCSMLYGSCARIARAMGYTKIITYTLLSETGASLKASNFTCEGVAGAPVWTGTRKRDNGVPAEMKKRWALDLTKGGRG